MTKSDSPKGGASHREGTIRNQGRGPTVGTLAGVGLIGLIGREANVGGRRPSDGGDRSPRDGERF